jgi:5-methylthioadenosine/S-adenosylhomocysteine deaminase
MTVSLLIKNALLLTLDQGNTTPYKGHVYIEGDTIKSILQLGDDLPEADECIEAEGCLVMPGLVNAHLHSDENMFKGLHDNMPLELWMLYAYPPIDYTPFSSRFIYLRTLLGAIEMIKGGVTAVQDDVSEWPTPSVEGIDAVMTAYIDVGLRANVAANLSDQPWYKKLPFLEDRLPQQWKAKCEGVADSRELLSVAETLIKKWHGYDNRIKYIIAPSGPQRCTNELLLGLGDLSERYQLPVHSHILETRMQRVTGDVMYGKTLIEHMDNLGLLNERLTVIHSVWVSDSDIQRMGNRGVTVAHNPASNLKLGSGIMPFRKLQELGVNIALGTDGMSSNDSQSIFESMKLTALLHKVTNPDYRTWPSAEEVLKMTIQGGARSGGWESTGSIAVGNKADLILLDVNTTSFTPMNKVANHLVYCENGQSVDTVIVAGKVILKNRKLTMIDEEAVLKELRELSHEFYERYERVTVKVSNELYPIIHDIYQESVERDVGMNRWLQYEWNQSYGK